MIFSTNESIKIALVRDNRIFYEQKIHKWL